MKSVTTSDRLRQLLSERGIKQVDILAAAKPYCEQYGIKLGKTDLSQYVTGKVIPGQDKLTVLGLALDVSEAWLMGYDVPARRAPDLTDIGQAVADVFAALPRNEQQLLDNYHRLSLPRQKQADDYVQYLAEKEDT